MTLRFAALALFVIAAGISCSESPTAPAPTAAVVSLTTPNTDDGALVVTVRGPELTDIQAVSSAHVVYSRYAPQEAHVIIVGDVGAGPLLTVKLGAGHAISEYSASIEQVAMRNDSLRVSTTGYQLSLSAAP